MTGTGPSSTARRVPTSVRLAADWTWRLLLFIAVGALLVVLIGRLRNVVLPVFLGVLLAALLTPVVTALRRLKVPPVVAAALTLLLFLGVLIGGIALVATSAVKQVEQLGPTLTNGVEELRNYLQDGPLHLGSERVDALAKSVTDALSRSSTYTGTVVSGASAGVSFLAGFVLAMFALFFFLKDGFEIRCWIIEHMPRHWRPAANRAADEVWQSLTSYTRGAVAVAAFDGVFIGIGLLILDVPLALSLALLTFLAAFVPIVGAVLAGAVAVLVALAAKGFGTAIAVLVVVLLVQQLEGNVLQPLIMRRAVELHPLVVVVSVAAGGTIAGVAGAALAVPVVAVLRVAITAMQRHADEVGEPPPPEAASPKSA
jgi:predicted PurR-regulated permease PerM